jgi:hypothetical protein
MSKVANYTPYARETLPGERRLVSFEGGEWFSVQKRPSILPRLVHFALSLIAICGFCGVVIAFVSKGLGNG